MKYHNGNANKMVSDTPRTDDESFFMHHSKYDYCKAGLARQLERELNAANDRIQSLIEERDRANRLADWKWNLRDEFQLLLGTDKIEEGIEAVKELKRRIKRLEEAGDAFINYPTPDIDAHFEELVENWRKAKEAKP